MEPKHKLAVIVALAAFAVAAGAATAGNPGSPVSHLHSGNLFMPCPDYPAAPDPSLSGCNGFALGGARVATATQAVILSVGDAEASQNDCMDGVDSATHVLAIDGINVPVTVDHCRYYPPDFQQINPFFRGHWAVFYKYLINPGTLTLGWHNLSFTTTWFKDQTYTLGCTDPSGRCTVPAGTIEVDAGQLLIE